MARLVCAEAQAFSFLGESNAPPVFEAGRLKLHAGRVLHPSRTGLRDFSPVAAPRRD
jgi:hypothetical protein